MCVCWADDERTRRRVTVNARRRGVCCAAAASWTSTTAWAPGRPRLRDAAANARAADALCKPGEYGWLARVSSASTAVHVDRPAISHAATFEGDPTAYLARAKDDPALALQLRNKVKVAAPPSFAAGR